MSKSASLSWMAVLGLLLTLFICDKVVAAPLPDFGLLYNNDGDQLYISTDITAATQGVNDLVGALAGTSVKTFMLSIGAGSDVLHYPTQVANNFGWRGTPYDSLPEWADRVTIGRHYAQVGFDPVHVAGAKAKSMGMFFVPSYRMNDDHFVVDPYTYPLTGEFWLYNPDKTIGASPVAGYDYSNLLSYAYQEVRDYRLAVINESIDRYSDIMDGYELDFNRVQIFFSPGTAQANAHLITDLVRQVRQRLDQVEVSTSRQQFLFARVPPALDNNAWSGLEVSQWMWEGIVDVVIPSVLQTLSHDVPVQEFVPAAQTYGRQVAPAIYPRTNLGIDFVARPGPAGYPSSSNDRVAQAELIRGAVSNYRYLGAAGVQFYNFSLPFTPDWTEAAQSAGSDSPTLGKDRIFAVTPSYFNDSEDTYEYAKQIPYVVPIASAHEFSMIVGDDILQMIRERPSAVVLRLGLTNVTSGTPLTLEINGHQLHSGPMTDGYYLLSLPATSDGPQAYYQTTVGNLLMLQNGSNTIKVTNPASSSGVRITDIQLGVFGATTPDPLTPPRVVREPQHGEVRQMYFDVQGPGMTFTVTDRPNNGLTDGLGGIYTSGLVNSYSAPYNHAAGFVFDQAFYYPSVEGAIESIDYSFYMAKTSGSRPTSLVGLLFMQDGKFFTLNDPFSFENGDPQTTITISENGLTAADFWEERANNDGFLLDPLSHPDFSETGAPIFVGWMLSRAGNPLIGNNDQPRTDLDDLIVTFHSVVNPASYGDYNANGMVDAADYVVWRDWLGQIGPGLAADGNNDLAVDQLDYDFWRTRFGSSAPGAGAGSNRTSPAVPEPSSAALFFAAFASLLRATRPILHVRRPGANRELV